jgi:hypothetical protein
MTLLRRLRAFVGDPPPVAERRDDDAPSYSVRCGDATFDIYGPGLDDEAGSWGRATVALSSIINRQLENSTHHLYAINGGNDLFGMFLRPADAAEAQRSLKNRTDWPYIPKDEPPWYGQPH